MNKFEILYVEDEEVTSELISEVLLDYCDKLHLAYDGEQGLKIFQEEKVDLVISDIQMPKMDGITMCKEIQKLNSKIPIIFTTAFTTDDKIKKRLQEIKIFHTVSKPITLDELVEEIEKVIALEK